MVLNPVSNELALKDNILIHVGTDFGDAKSPAQEILRISLEPTTGHLCLAGPPISTKPLQNPGWISRYNNRNNDLNCVYVALENSPGQLQAYSVVSKEEEEEGFLFPLGKAVSSVGNDPCYCQLDGTGKWLLAANYSTGSVCVVPVLPDGSLGNATDSKQHHSHSSIPNELKDRQEGPHAHCIIPHPSNQWVVVCDLGLSTVFVYAFDDNRGSLIGAADDLRHLRLPANAGPRHCCWDKTGTTLYIHNELTCTVTAACFDILTGVLTESTTTSVLPLKDMPDRSHHRGGSDIGLHPNGRFLYAGCRSTSPSGMIAILEISTPTSLKVIGHESTRGQVPRNFKLLQGQNGNGEDCHWLVMGNQESKTVVSYKVDPESGVLTFCSQICTDPYKPCNIASEKAIWH